VTTARAFQLRAKWVSALGGIQPGVRWGQMMRRTFLGVVRRYGPIGAVRALRAMTRVQDAMLPSLAAWHLRDVRALAVPIALVHGGADAISPPALVRDWVSALAAPSATFRVLDGAGHLPHLDQPEPVREVVAATLA
jgi:pimeloyl-ACP methyl ester carboxylesterase